MGSLIDHLIGFRVNKLHACHALDSLFAEIKDTSRDCCLIALTDKARHVRLNHHILLRHSLSFEHTIAEVCGMC